MEPSPQPTYVLPQVRTRVIIPKTITLLVLGGIFYLGVILNLSLLQVSQQTSALARSITAAVIVLFLVLGLLIASSRSKKKYLFYRDRIVFGEKQVFYREINSLSRHYSFWDSPFKTYSLSLTISLNHKFVLKHISRTIDITDYIQKMITYSSSFL